MRHRVATGIGFGPALIAHQIGLEHLEPVPGIGPAFTQARLALGLVAHRCVDCVALGQKLVDYLTADIAGAAGYEYCTCHLCSPLRRETMPQGFERQRD